MLSKELSDTYLGKGPKRVLNWEHFSDPDAATYITGIDYYQRPRDCMKKLFDMYPFIKPSLPEDNDPIPRPEEQAEGSHGRWGAQNRDFWQQEIASHRFKTEEQIRSFSPLENADYSNTNIFVESADFSSEASIYKRYMKRFQKRGIDKKPPESSSAVSFYNTLFMWPLLTFGYQNFLTYCMEDWFKKIMDEFAEISRRVFRAFSRLPVNYVICHDDIVLPTGPVCSPNWMHKHIFPRYEEYWDILKAGGKQVLFMADGNMDAYADDIMACGALGIISEPFTDYKKLAKKYEDPFLAGEGDVRVLMRNEYEEIKKMVLDMTKTARMSGGYMMCIGNHIPFNTPPEAVKTYFDLCAEYAYR
jgi:hypothetical protein